MRQLEKEKQKKEHILVCLSSSPSNEKIIRTAAQMAQAFQAGFTALYVQTAEKTEKTPEDLARLQKHVRLAEQSGAEIVTTHSEDIALQIAEYARISEVTRIVIGKSMMKQGYFHQRRVWTERLTDLVPDLEIHIIPDSDVYQRYQKRKKNSGVDGAAFLERTNAYGSDSGCCDRNRRNLFSAWFYGCQYYYGISVWRHADIYSDQRLYL